MRVLFAVLALSLVCARPVAAQLASGSADARALQLYEQGDAAYAAGRYQEAADAFAQAYQLSPRPLLLYNLANAYERLERYPDAIQMLRAYLDSAPIGEHAELQARIANLERLAAGGGGGGGGTGELLLPGVIVAAAGGALLATGVIFGVLALDAGARLEGEAGTCQRTADARLLCQGAADGAIADYSTFALVADIGLIGGGVAVAAGVTLIVLSFVGGGSSSAASAVIPTLQVGPDGAWAGVGGSF